MRFLFDVVTIISDSWNDLAVVFGSGIAILTDLWNDLTALPGLGA